MNRHVKVALTTLGMLMLLGPAAALSDAGRSDVILGGSQAEVDYHAEAAAARPADGGATIIGGNIQIASDRGTRGGLAGACDPDPRFGTHPRPEDGGCEWAVPAGTGQDFISFGRQIQNDLPVLDGELPNDTDTSPNGAFTPIATPTRERFNGRGGLGRDGALFIERRYVIEDEDLNFRILGTGITNYLSPQGNADNRWRRLCGTGVVETFDHNAPITAPFADGQTRAFVIQIWDADFKDPSNADGGNQDYYIVDVFKSGTSFDVASCRPKPQVPNQPPPPVVGVKPAAPPPPAPAPAPTAVAPARPTVAGGGVLGTKAVAPGRARIAGARTCPVRPFGVRVSGRSIRRVTFSVDGRRIGTVTRADRLGRWQVRIDPRRMRAGTHRIVARVEFVSGAGPARTLRTSFRTCARPAAQVAPSFTG